jgi:hypothetical protein
MSSLNKVEGGPPMSKRIPPSRRMRKALDEVINGARSNENLLSEIIGRAMVIIIQEMIFFLT